MSHSIASIFERLTTFRESLLSLLLSKDIISATKELNLQINDWETKNYMTELRQLFCEVSWLLAVISTEVRVIIIDKDLNRVMQHRRISRVELINVVILIEFVNEINVFVSKFETFREIFEQCTRDELSKWNITAVNEFNDDDDCYHAINFTTDDDFTIVYMFSYFNTK
jgi:sensor domain CHASE-containing protein